MACACSTEKKNNVPCPTHGFAEKLEEAARGLVVAVDHKSGIKAAMDKIQGVFAEISNAKHNLGVDQHMDQHIAVDSAVST